MTGAEFGARIRELRTRRKLTQVALAEASGIAVDTLSRIEHGRFNPTLAVMNKLAAGLGVTITELINPNYETADDLAAMIRRLPVAEQRLACLVVVALCVYAVLGE